MFDGTLCKVNYVVDFYIAGTGMPKISVEKVNIAIPGEGFNLQHPRWHDSMAYFDDP